MKSKIGISLVCLLALAFACATVPAFADPAWSVEGVVYDNTGPGSNTTNAWSVFDIGGGAYAVTDSFTLSYITTVQDANFNIWVLPDDSLTSVNWAIMSTVDGTPIASGTAAGGPNTQVATAFSYYPVLQESIAIPNVVLQPGTYYIQLSEGQDAYDNNVWWDESDGASTAYETGGIGAIPSETFQIVGTPTPEPSSFLLLGSAMLTLAGLAVRRKLTA
jgi:hypothetical protein